MTRADDDVSRGTHRAHPPDPTEVSTTLRRAVFDLKEVPMASTVPEHETDAVVELPTSTSFARPLPRVVAVANQKGGVGKTTTAINLGACLADLGYRTLVIDLDPQGNASTGLGIDTRTLDSSMYDVVMHELPLEDCI